MVLFVRRLQDFLFYGQIDFPLEALRIFLEAKQGGNFYAEYLAMEVSPYYCR